MSDEVMVKSIMAAFVNALNAEDGPLFVRVRRRDLADAIRVMASIIEDSGDPAMEARATRAMLTIGLGAENHVRTLEPWMCGHTFGGFKCQKQDGHTGEHGTLSGSTWDQP
jgi:hypothetical protein